MINLADFVRVMDRGWKGVGEVLQVEDGRARIGFGDGEHSWWDSNELLPVFRNGDHALAWMESCGEEFSAELRRRHPDCY